MKADEQIYSMRTLKQQEMINRRKKTKIMIILIILLFILIFTANKAISSIKIQKQAKEYEKQAIEYSKEQKRIEEKKRSRREKKRENLVQITEKGKQNFETIYHSENKRVFLTFDDGPSTVTSTILQTLNEKGVKATFFVLGSNAEHNPDMVKKCMNRDTILLTTDTHTYIH